MSRSFLSNPRAYRRRDAHQADACAADKIQVRRCFNDSTAAYLQISNASHEGNGLAPLVRYEWNTHSGLNPTSRIVYSTHTRLNECDET